MIKKIKEVWGKIKSWIILIISFVLTFFAGIAYIVFRNNSARNVIEKQRDQLKQNREYIKKIEQEKKEKEARNNEKKELNKKHNDLIDSVNEHTRNLLD